MALKLSGLVALALVGVRPAAAAERAARPADAPPPIVKEAATGMELVLVKGGCFQMGDIYHDGVSDAGESHDEQPVHEVCVGDLYVGKYEVTQGQWKKVMKRNPSGSAACKDDRCPVDSLTWRDVQEFLGKLNRKARAARYRLPTEAEWEYAARSGGRNERYSGGNDVDSVSWYEANSGYRVDATAPIYHPVGSKLPNALGLYDMSGNVYELTSDWYGATYYATSPRDGPTGPESGELRVKRGGCASGHPGNSRTARRARWVDGDGSTGLRLVRTP